MYLALKYLIIRLKQTQPNILMKVKLYFMCVASLFGFVAAAGFLTKKKVR